ncbi:hypothetical protein ABKV19_023845 [Rosa sericea]
MPISFLINKNRRNKPTMTNTDSDVTSSTTIATNFPAPTTPSSPVTLEIKILFHSKSGKVVLATADSRFVQLLYGFMLFPVSTALNMLDAGAITALCESLKQLENPHIRDGFDKTQIFKAKPTTFPLPDPKLIALMNGDCSADFAVSEDDFYYQPTAYSCENCPLSYLTRDPKSRCKSCYNIMDTKVIPVHSASKASNEAAGGGFVKHDTRFVISDNMDIKAQDCDFDMVQLTEGYDVSELETIRLPITELSVLLLFKHCVQRSKNILTEFYRLKLIVDENKKNEVNISI